MAVNDVRHDLPDEAGRETGAIPAAYPRLQKGETGKQ
jgi:hypothetical protein